jgi:hypothetical protein
MCHLITVQNLLMSVDNHPSFGRQDQDPAPCLDPIPFSLRPLTKAVLEDFLLAEMPPFDDMTSAEKAIMEPIIASHSSPVESVNPVGLIYARLYWLFQKDDQCNPWCLFMAVSQVHAFFFTDGSQIEVDENVTDIQGLV